MVTGKPAVPVVKDNNQRSIEGALAAVRERLRQIEAEVNSVARQAGESSLKAGQSNGSIANLQQQLTLLQNQVNQLALSVTSDTIQLAADVAIPDFTGIFMSSVGGVSPIDPLGPNDVFAARGVVAQGGASGSTITVRLYGKMDVPGAAFDPGLAVFAEAGGGLTQFPTYTNFAVPLGVALTANSFFVYPDWPTLLNPTNYSEQQDFVPASYRLAKDAIEFMLLFNSQPDGIVVKNGENSIIVRTIGSDGETLIADSSDPTGLTWGTPTPPSGDAILLEDGFVLLLEDGSELLLEA